MRAGCVLFAVAAQLLQVGCGLKILSFNIQNFGEKKYHNQPVVDVLLKVYISRICYNSRLHKPVNAANYYSYVLPSY